MKATRAVIFDFDYTLADSSEGAVAVLDDLSQLPRLVGR